MVDNTREAVISPLAGDEMKNIVHEHVGIYLTSLSFAPRAEVKQHSVEVTPDLYAYNFKITRSNIVCSGRSSLMNRFDVVLLTQASPLSARVHLFWLQILVSKSSRLRSFFVWLPNIQCVTNSWFQRRTVVHKVGIFQVVCNVQSIHGYWQLPLDRSSQYCHSFISPNSSYSST